MLTQMEKAEQVRENFKIFKEKYINTPELLFDEYFLNTLNIEHFHLPTFFKRISFVFSNNYVVSEPSFYGDIIFGTNNPKTICFICLLIIHHFSDLGYDRYGIILDILKMVKTNDNELVLVSCLKEYTLKLLHKEYEKKLNKDLK